MARRWLWAAANFQEMFARSKIRPTRCATAIVLASCTAALGANWLATLSKQPAGDFAELRSLRASYRFGWSGLTAATGEIHFIKPSNDRFELDGTGRTTGLVRALWKLDVNYRAIANAQTLAPIEVQQTENYRSKQIITHLSFTDGGVTRSRTEGQGAAIDTKTREFALPNLFDLHSAALYLRTQPLGQGSVYRLAVYPATNAYLATVTVSGREKISVRAGTYNAIRLDLQLKRIGKNLELQPHRKFRRGTIWVSDDPDRLIVRIEAQVFVGTVFAELQSVRFDNPKQASRELTDLQSVGLAEDACAGGKDRKTADAGRAISAMPPVFPSLTGQSPKVLFAIDKRAGKVPSLVRRFRRSVPDTAHTARGLSAPTQSHCAARPAELSQMACRRKILPVNCSDPLELMDKLAGFAAEGQRAERAAPELCFRSPWTVARWA